MQGGRRNGNPADTPPSLGRGCFPGWSNDPSVLAHPRQRTDPLLSAAGKPYFLRPAESLGIRDSGVHPRLSASCLAISRASRCSPAQRVPFCSWESASQSCTSLPAWKAPLRGRIPWSAPYVPASGDHQLQRTDPQMYPPSSEVLTSPQSLRFPRRLLHRPIAPQRLLSFQMGR